MQLAFTFSLFTIETKKKKGVTTVSILMKQSILAVR